MKTTFDYVTGIELRITADCDSGRPGKMGKDPDDSSPPEYPSAEVEKVEIRLGMNKDGKDVYMDAPRWLENLLEKNDHQEVANAALESAGIK